MTNNIIKYSFYALFLITPLFFTKFNNELFEYNKMMLVYGLTTVIVTSWFVKQVREKTLKFKSTPLDIPIILFLLSQIVSTFLSIDTHTSLWGYYSRSNGGLFSIISYILLFYALVSNFEKPQVLNFLKAAVFGGVLVSLYAIPEHFGLSPSCVILVNEFNASCWVQDVEARVFATLGQPNWLAAYLAMLIFPTIYFAITAKNKLSSILYSIFSILMYMAFTFTFSRGATLGLIAGGLVFIVLTSVRTIFFETSVNLVEKTKRFLPLLLILAAFISINLFYGSALTRFKLFNEAPKAVTQEQQAQEARQEAMQLEVGGGTESGQIRLIVWEGALEIFKKYPLFGSGVETFAYSYYNHRPAKHNLVSEWDFLYNKAHNEYLNYLATTGLVGFISYMSMILIFIIWCISCIVNRVSLIAKNDQLLIIALLSAYISYLVQNIFGFSVVVIAMFFFLFPAIAFVIAGSTKNITISPNLQVIKYFLNKTIFRSEISNLGTKILLVLFGLMILFNLVTRWIADVYYKDGSDLADSGNPVSGFKLLKAATRLNPDEPLYKADLGFAAAGYSVVALEQKEATIAARYKDEAVFQTTKALEISPNNTSIQRTVFQTFYQLSLVYPELKDKTIAAVDYAIASAPTDAKLYYNKALVLSQFDRKKEALEALQKAIELKPNYREARFNMAVVLFELGKEQEAKEQMKIILKQIPNDPDVLEKLKEWEEKE